MKSKVNTIDGYFLHLIKENSSTENSHVFTNSTLMRRDLSGHLVNAYGFKLLKQGSDDELVNLKVSESFKPTNFLKIKLNLNSQTSNFKGKNFEFQFRENGKALNLKKTDVIPISDEFKIGSDISFTQLKTLNVKHGNFICSKAPLENEPLMGAHNATMPFVFPNSTDVRKFLINDKIMKYNPDNETRNAGEFFSLDSLKNSINKYSNVKAYLQDNQLCLHVDDEKILGLEEEEYKIGEIHLQIYSEYLMSEAERKKEKAIKKKKEMEEEISLVKSNVEFKEELVSKKESSFEVQKALFKIEESAKSRMQKTKSRDSRKASTKEYLKYKKSELSKMLGRQDETSKIQSKIDGFKSQIAPLEDFEIGFLEEIFNESNSEKLKNKINEMEIYHLTKMTRVLEKKLEGHKELKIGMRDYQKLDDGSKAKNLKKKELEDLKATLNLKGMFSINKINDKIAECEGKVLIYKNLKKSMSDLQKIGKTVIDKLDFASKEIIDSCNKYLFNKFKYEIIDLLNDEIEKSSEKEEDLLTKALNSFKNLSFRLNESSKLVNNDSLNAVKKILKEDHAKMLKALKKFNDEGVFNEELIEFNEEATKLMESMNYLRSNESIDKFFDDFSIPEVKNSVKKFKLEKSKQALFQKAYDDVKNEEYIIHDKMQELVDKSRKAKGKAEGQLRDAKREHKLAESEYKQLLKDLAVLSKKISEHEKEIIKIENGEYDEENFNFHDLGFESYYENDLQYFHNIGGLAHLINDGDNGFSAEIQSGYLRDKLFITAEENMLEVLIKTSLEQEFSLRSDKSDDLHEYVVPASYNVTGMNNLSSGVVQADFSISHYVQVETSKSSDQRKVELKIGFLKIDENVWIYEVMSEDFDLIEQNSQSVLEFNFDGSLRSVSGFLKDGLLYKGKQGDLLQNIQFDIGQVGKKNGFTQLDFSNDLRIIKDDSVKAGNLKSHDIDESGIVRSKYTNNVIYEVAIASIRKFENVDECLNEIKLPRNLYVQDEKFYEMTDGCENFLDICDDCVLLGV